MGFRDPVLVHPVPVVISPINRGATVVDPDTREPIMQAARSADVTLNGQVFFSTTTSSMRAQRAGVVAGEKGAVTFLTKDLVAKGLVFREEGGDRLKKVGDVEMNAYSTRVEWLGSYPGKGHTLCKVYFADRAPAKKTT